MSKFSTPITAAAPTELSVRSRWRGWFMMFIGAVLIYGLTANRGAQWQDSGEHIWRIVSGELINVRGLALSHPLHYWLGRFAIAPGWVEPCYAITLVSALAGALAVANVYGCVVSLTQRTGPALFAAVSLAVSHTFWQMSTVTETYTLTAALLAAECWALVDFVRTRRTRSLALMFLFNGMGVANHMLAILTTPVLLVIAIIGHRRGRIPPRHLAIVAAIWLIGSIPYTVFVLLEMVQTGDLSGTVHSALFGNAYAGAVLNLVPSARQLLICICFALLSFPNLLHAFALIGIGQVRRLGNDRRAFRALFAGLIIHLIFALRYDVVDQHTFFIPSYVFLAIFGGAGLSVMLTHFSRRISRPLIVAAVAAITLTPCLYALTPAIARRFDALGDLKHNKPYRDDYIYLFTPWSIVDDSAQRMATQAVELAGHDGIILVEDGMAAPAIKYAAWRTLPDGRTITRTVEPDVIERALSELRPVVLVPQNVDYPQTDPVIGAWKRTGDLYVLESLEIPLETND